jgi:hypothetical protein
LLVLDASNERSLEFAFDPTPPLLVTADTLSCTTDDEQPTQLLVLAKASVKSLDAAVPSDVLVAVWSVLVSMEELQTRQLLVFAATNVKS